MKTPAHVVRLPSMKLQLIEDLFAPMLWQKQQAIMALKKIAAKRAELYPTWWAWTVWLAIGITIARIEAA